MDKRLEYSEKRHATYMAHKDKHNAQSKAYYRRNKDYIKKRNSTPEAIERRKYNQRFYYYRHREELKAKFRAYYKAHKSHRTSGWEVTILDEINS